MNLTFICSARTWGGNEKWSVMAARALASRGHTVHFIARRAFFEPRLAGTPVRFHRMPLVHELDPVTFARLVWHIKKEQIDVVLPTKVKDYWLGGMAARLAGASVAIRLGIVRRLRPLFPKDWLSYGVLPHRIIVNAQAIKTELANTPWIRPDRIVVIYNCVEPLAAAVPKAGLRAQYAMPSQAFVAIAVGRLTPRKGFDLLVRALSKVSATHPQSRLVLVGDGHQRAALTHLAQKLDVSDKLVFAGACSQPLPLIADADVLVAPSRQEGLPNTILEAWQVGTPVVATNVAGAAEVIRHGENGYLVPPDDAQALADCLAGLIEQPEQRQHVASEGTRTLQQRHTPSRMADDLERTLQEIVPDASNRV